MCPAPGLWCRWGRASPPRSLRPQFDYERDSGVEPVAVELLDLRPRWQPAQVQVALAVVEQVDRLAQRLPRLLQLCRLLALPGDARERPAADPQAHARVRPDVPQPPCGGRRAGHRQRGGPQLDEVRPVATADHADALASRLAGPAPG